MGHMAQQPKWFTSESHNISLKVDFDRSSFYDQWPIGLAVSSTGRIFTDYTRGSYPYTLGEVVNQTSEKPYPSLELQVEASALGNKSSGINFATNNSTAFISVQALIITAKATSRNETLWVLDTGRSERLQYLDSEMSHHSRTANFVRRNDAICQSRRSKIGGH